MAGMIVLLDRTEKLVAPGGREKEDKTSVIGTIRMEYGIPVPAILTQEDTIRGLGNSGREEDVESMDNYRAKYKESD